jgi:hypothetical protein
MGFLGNIFGKVAQSRASCLFCKSNISPFDSEESTLSVSRYGIYSNSTYIYHRSCFVSELESPTCNEMCDKAIALADLIEAQERKERELEAERQAKRKEALNRLNSPKSETFLTNEELKLRIYELECEVSELENQLKETTKELESLNL